MLVRASVLQVIQAGSVIGDEDSAARYLPSRSPISVREFHLDQASC
jgi:hypothetical protein